MDVTDAGYAAPIGWPWMQDVGWPWMQTPSEEEKEDETEEGEEEEAQDALRTDRERERERMTEREREINTIMDRVIFELAKKFLKDIREAERLAEHPYPKREKSANLKEYARARLAREMKIQEYLWGFRDNLFKKQFWKIIRNQIASYYVPWSGFDGKGTWLIGLEIRNPLNEREREMLLSRINDMENGEVILSTLTSEQKKTVSELFNLTHKKYAKAHEDASNDEVFWKGVLAKIRNDMPLPKEFYQPRNLPMRRTVKGKRPRI